MKKLAMLFVVLLVMSGCATGPYSPVKTSSLKGERVIYFEQSDRVPKVVMLASWENDVMSGTSARSFDPTAVIAVIEKMLTTYPEVVKAYGEERMANALISRRILIKGYSTNELAEIGNMIKSMELSIEKWTPKNP